MSELFAHEASLFFFSTLCFLQLAHKKKLPHLYFEQLAKNIGVF